MEALLERYVDMFGDAFPTFQLMQTRTDAEVMEILKRCLSEKRSAYELGYVSDSLDDIY